MHKTTQKRTVSRRAVILGSAATTAALALPLSAIAKSDALFSKFPARKQCEPTLAKYLCSQVHDEIARNLDVTISDPVIDGEQTALALMEARCPGCGERVHPATSSISAVIPKWKTKMSAKPARLLNNNFA